MVAKGILKIDMVALDSLQRLYRVQGAALEQPQSAEIAHARPDKFVRLIFDGLHLGIQVMVGVHQKAILAIQDSKTARRYFRGVELPAFMHQKMIVPRRPVGGEHVSDGPRWGERR